MIGIVWPFLSCLSAAPSASCIGVDESTVKIQIRVANPADSQLIIPSGLPLTVFTRKAEITTITDREGRASVDAALEDNETRAWVSFGFFGNRSSRTRFSKEEVEGAWAKYLTLRRCVAVERFYEFEIPRNQDAVERVITFSTPATVIGKVVGEKGDFVSVSIYGKGLDRFDRTEPDGVFHRLVPAGVSTDIYIKGASPEVKIVSIPADRAHDQVELAPIDVAAPIKGVAVAIEVKEVAPLRDRRDGDCCGVTLVSKDGSLVLSYATDAVFMWDGGKVVDPQTHQPPQVPVGEYFVVPGTFRASLTQTLAIDAARAGRDLHALGVPVLTVRDGENPQLSIDAAAVDDALRGLSLGRFGDDGHPR